MTQTQIRTFLIAAECLSFTETAKELGVSQQVVSKHMKTLESELSIALFARDSKKLMLTRSGEILYEGFKRMENEINLLINRAAEAAKIPQRKIRIGVCEMAEVVDYVYLVLEEFCQQHKEVEMDYQVDSFAGLQEQLKRKKLDLICTLESEMPQLKEGFGVCHVEDLQLVLIISGKHPLAKKETLTLEDIQGETFYILEDSYASASMEKITKHVELAGLTLDSVKTVKTLHNLEVAIAAGKGVTLGFSQFFRNKGGLLKMYPVPTQQEMPVPSIVLTWKLEEESELTDLIYAFKEQEVRSGQ